MNLVFFFNKLQMFLWICGAVITVQAETEGASITESQACPVVPEVPVVRKLSDIHQDNYGRPGLAHMTLAGAVNQGMKEVEVWLQTFAPGSGTPIHRHACEEVFVNLKGTGTLFLSSNFHEGKVPGLPKRIPVAHNSTFLIPVNAVHQLKNTDFEEDLQVLVVISRPPVRVFLYEDWLTPHENAKLQYPYYWDAEDINKPDFSCNLNVPGLQEPPGEL